MQIHVQYGVGQFELVNRFLGMGMPEQQESPRAAPGRTDQSAAGMIDRTPDNSLSNVVAEQRLLLFSRLPGKYDDQRFLDGPERDSLPCAGRCRPDAGHPD